MVGKAFTEAELAIVRHAFARQMMAVAGVQNERLEHAFSVVRREDFLGKTNRGSFCVGL